jgi:hypothetical protein
VIRIMSKETNSTPVAGSVTPNSSLGRTVATVLSNIRNKKTTKLKEHVEQIAKYPINDASRSRQEDEY